MEFASCSFPQQPGGQSFTHPGSSTSGSGTALQQNVNSVYQVLATYIVRVHGVLLR